MTLAEYFRKAHPSPVKMTRPFTLPPTHVSVPVDVIGRGKMIVLVGIALSYLLPPQYAALPGVFAGAFWLFKL